MCFFKSWYQYIWKVQENQIFRKSLHKESFRNKILNPLVWHVFINLDTSIFEMS